MTITTVETEIPRDRWGRPLVIPPGGGKPVGYTRCTTFVGCLEDTYNLSKWQMRMVAKGLAARPDLHLAVAATPIDDKRKLDQLCEDAKEAAAASAAATTGTAIHGLTELVDRGDALPLLPDSALADLEAYRRATEALTVVQVEQFGVVDDLKVGGTWDRLVEYQGRRYIADIKTGSIEYGAGKIAMQLAVYSRATLYDWRTGTRAPQPVPVDQDRGIVIHVPAGTGTAELKWVDLAAGWEAVQHALWVHGWRKRKDLMADFADAAIVFDVPAQPEPPALDGLARLHHDVANAPDVDTLTALWTANQGTWNDDLTRLAAARKALLAAGVA